MTRELYYPPADRTARWKGQGNVTMPGIDKLVMHSTETRVLPSYSSSWPTITYDPWQHRWYQHLPINGSATALVDPSSTPVRENRDNVCQLEIVGYCDPSLVAKYGHPIDDLDQQAIKDLGGFVAWLHTEWGLELSAMAAWMAYPASYGNTRVRMSSAQFDAFKGICGHQHVPGNSHGDPGLLDVVGVLEAAQEALRPQWDGVSFPGADAFVLGQTHPAVTLLGQRLLVHDFTAHRTGPTYQPGPRFSETDQANVADFQRDQGWSGDDADGYPGPGTWRLLMADPVTKAKIDGATPAKHIELPAVQKLTRPSYLQAIAPVGTGHLLAQAWKIPHTGASTPKGAESTVFNRFAPTYTDRMVCVTAGHCTDFAVDGSHVWLAWDKLSAAGKVTGRRIARILYRPGTVTDTAAGIDWYDPLIGGSVTPELDADADRIAIRSAGSKADTFIRHDLDAFKAGDPSSAVQVVAAVPGVCQGWSFYGNRLWIYTGATNQPAIITEFRWGSNKPIATLDITAQLKAVGATSYEAEGLWVSRRPNPALYAGARFGSTAKRRFITYKITDL